MIMSENKMNDFIEKVSRTELFDEIKENPNNSPKYLKAIRVTLTTLGFNNEWVEGEFKAALEKRYLCK